MSFPFLIRNNASSYSLHHLNIRKGLRFLDDACLEKRKRGEIMNATNQ